MVDMSTETIKLHPSWKEPLLGEFKKEYMVNLKTFLKDELNRKKKIYPKPQHFFEALNLTPLEKVKVVILGQDPYHGLNQAHGLSFSVRPEVPPPPSLVNIFKEIKNDLGVHQPGHGYLKSWAEQGILLLNATLSVEAGKAGSHQKKGWELFTDQIIQLISQSRVNIVYLLWGSYAQKKGSRIDKKNNLVLQSVHPSPLSAYRGFFGCRHFSKANEYLEQQGFQPIDWQLPKIEN